jgi:hypothetical protein
MRVIPAAALLLCALMLAAPARAETASVEGLWSPDQLSDYRVSLCGPQKDRLCFTVAALRKAADSARNRPYLGKTIIDGAKPDGANRWEGRLDLFGQSADSTITFRAPDTIELKACMLLVVCQSIVMKRIGD